MPVGEASSKCVAFSFGKRGEGEEGTVLEIVKYMCISVVLICWGDGEDCWFEL